MAHDAPDAGRPQPVIKVAPVSHSRVFGTLADLSLSPDEGKKPVVRTSELSPIRLEPAAKKSDPKAEMDFLSLSRPD